MQCQTSMHCHTTIHVTRRVFIGLTVRVYLNLEVFENTMAVDWSNEAMKVLLTIQGEQNIIILNLMALCAEQSYVQECFKNAVMNSHGSIAAYFLCSHVNLCVCKHCVGNLFHSIECTVWIA